MSKVEMLIYVAMAMFLVALVPTEEVPFMWQAALAFAGALLGIVAWNVLNETWEDNDD